MVFTTLSIFNLRKKNYMVLFTHQFLNLNIINIKKSIKKMVIMKKMEKMILGKILRNEIFMSK